MLTRALLTLALLAACSSGSEAPSHDPSAATYSANGVAFEYPSSWVSLGETVAEGAAWSWVFGPAQGLGYVEVIAYETGVEPTGEQMQEFAEGLFRFVQSEAAGDEPKGGTTETTVAGSDALEARFVRSLGPEVEPVEIRALVFAHGTTAYALDCFNLSEDVTAGCEQVISSFRFED